MNKGVRKIFFLLLIYIIFFSFDFGVMAKPNGESYGENDLYMKCNDENKCLILCAYGAIDGDDYSKVEDEKIQNLNENAYIGLNYSNFDDMYWNLASLNIKKRDPKYYPVGTNLYYLALQGFSSDVLPYSDIYWGPDKGKSWKSTDAYQSLNDSFKCPLNFYSASDIDPLDTSPIFCYDNTDSDSCQKNHKGGFLGIGKNNFSPTHPLVYDFSRELASLVTSAYNDMFQGDNEIQYLFKADPNLEYDESISAEENIKNNCSYFSGIKDANSYSYILKNNFDNYKNEVIDKRLAQYANKYNSRNKNIYTFDNLSNILVLQVDDKGVPTEVRKMHDTDVYEILNKMYTEPIVYSMRTIKSKCDAVNVEEVGVKDNLDEYLEQTVHRVEVDLVTEFDCNSLFTSDLVDMINGAYFVLEIGAIIMTIVLTVLDYAKVILNSDQDGMKKANKKLLTRLIIVIVIFLLPAILNSILKLLNIEGFNSENPLCVKIKNK